MPRMRETNLPISSLGAPVLPGGLRRLLLVSAAAAARENLGAADQEARIDAERPADDAEHDDGADAEPAAAAHREAETAASAAARRHRRGDPRCCRLRQIIPAHQFLLSAPLDSRRRGHPSPLPGKRRSCAASDALFHDATATWRVCTYGYSKPNASIRFSLSLSRFLPWLAKMRAVGCQVFASPTAYPSDVQSCVCRVAGRPVGRPA